MALPAEVGDKTQIRLANCNFMVGCESCWFDDERVDPMQPMCLTTAMFETVA